MNTYVRMYHRSLHNGCLKLVGVGILPQPSPYKDKPSPMEERRATQLKCNAGQLSPTPHRQAAWLLRGGPPYSID